MSLDHQTEMLKFLVYYNKVEIVYTFNKDGQPIASVCCLKNTNTIQITFFPSQITEHYESIKEAAFILEELSNQYSVS